VFVALSLGQLLDGLAVSVDGPRATDEHIVLNWLVDGDRAVTTLNDGVLTYVLDASSDAADATVTAGRPAIAAALGGDLSGISVAGDATAPVRMLGLLDRPDPDFEIVAP
jgi:alkyl sulfatase BDS1-like metallo-beta-lactamase superfamily hydrolase